jgi:hypothetical protein
VGVAENHVTGPHVQVADHLGHGPQAAAAQLERGDVGPEAADAQVVQDADCARDGHPPDGESGQPAAHGRRPHLP